MNQNKINLGELKLLDVRTIWRNESSDFTPRLSDSEHVVRRSSVPGIELKLEKAGQGLPVSGWRKRK